MIKEIDINKQYRTKDGREVRIYATDGVGAFKIHGAICCDGNWHIDSWQSNGCCNAIGESDRDLVEVKPRIKRTYWASLYEHGFIGMSETKSLADELAREGRLACVKIEIDCEEGEGL